MKSQTQDALVAEMFAKQSISGTERSSDARTVWRRWTQAIAGIAEERCTVANFESGVSRYIIGKHTVYAHFPVDKKGNADISCSQCFFFREASRRCGLTGEISEYPNKYVGSCCPLEMEEE